MYRAHKMHRGPGRETRDCESSSLAHVARAPFIFHSPATKARVGFFNSVEVGVISFPG